MKNILLLQIIFPIIFAFIFYACSDFSGNEDAVEASLKPGPVTQQQQQQEEEESDTRTYYDLDAITFGNNTFVAVGEFGTVRTSSDGSTWDNGTKGTRRQLYEIAYGDSTFVAVGQSGTHIYSRDNGATWDNGTWSDSDLVTGVAFGNNTFVGVSSTYLTRSTDNGSNWIRGCSGVRVHDIAFGNSKFVGSGAEGAIQISDNGSGCSTPSGTGSRTTEETLSGITFGNNRFLTVGTDGWLSITADNGNNFTALTIPTGANDLKSAAYGNNIFVAVGIRSVVVSNNDASTNPILKENTLSFNDVTFGNGIFVAVGDDENIYTSTDGDTWTKVYGKP